MNTKIELNYKGTEYVLEYNRYAVKVLEENGYDSKEILNKPMTNIELLFQCAFIKNHPKVQLSVIDEILKSCPDKNNLFVTLKTMVDETYDALLAEPNEDDSKNVSWKTVDLSPKKKETKVQE